MRWRWPHGWNATEPHVSGVDRTVGAGDQIRRLNPLECGSVVVDVEVLEIFHQLLGALFFKMRFETAPRRFFTRLRFASFLRIEGSQDVVDVDGLPVRDVIHIVVIVVFRLLAHVTGPVSKEGAAVIRQRRTRMQEGQCTS
jgi:hypothetical protein